MKLLENKIAIVQRKSLKEDLENLKLKFEVVFDQ